MPISPRCPESQIVNSRDFFAFCKPSVFLCKNCKMHDSAEMAYAFVCPYVGYELDARGSTPLFR